MPNKIIQSLIGGITGTLAMTMVTLIAPMMGMPKMNPAEMLAGMLGLPVAIGWLMHFMIGIIFAMAYAFFFFNLIKKVTSKILKGVIFGFAVFIFAQIMLSIMGMFMPMPPMEGSMMLIMVGSIVGHLVFGIVTVMFIKEPLARKIFG